MDKMKNINTELFGEINRKKIIKSAGTVLGLVIIFVVIVLGSHALNFKRAYNNATDAKGVLDQALVSIQEKNFEMSASYFSQAQEKLYSAVKEVEPASNSKLVGIIPYVNKQIDGVYNLLFAMERISASGADGFKIADELTTILGEDYPAKSYRDLSGDKKSAFVRALSTKTDEIRNIESKVNEALVLVNSITDRNALSFFADKIDILQRGLEAGDKTLKLVVPLLNVLPELSGVDNKEAVHLIIFQNTDKLRATGGAFGTYGILKMLNGDIGSFDTYDTYYFDKKTSAGVSVGLPEFVRKYVPNFNNGMQYTNWSPDWPSSARKIQQVYVIGQSGMSESDLNYCGQVCEVDSIIAINPKAIIDVMDFVLEGGIKVNNKIYTSDNFIENVENELDAKYSVNGDQVKKIFMDALQENFKEQVTSASFYKAPLLVASLYDSLERRDIMIYPKSNSARAAAEENDWLGKIKSDVSGDYFMVVDTNIDGIRADKDIDKNISYVVDERDGELFAKLTVVYDSFRADFANDYKNYVRFYLPVGSDVVSVNGSGNIYGVNNEYGKTVVETVLTFKAGERTSVSVEYKLPDLIVKLFNEGEYTLYAQKQSGSIVRELNVLFTADRNINLMVMDDKEIEKMSDNEAVWVTDFEKDKTFGLKLK